MVAVGITALSPDELIAGLVRTTPVGVAAVLTARAGALKNPPMAVEELRELLRKNGLSQSMALLTCGD